MWLVDQCVFAQNILLLNLLKDNFTAYIIVLNQPPIEYRGERKDFLKVTVTSEIVFLYFQTGETVQQVCPTLVEV